MKPSLLLASLFYLIVSLEAHAQKNKDQVLSPGQASPAKAQTETKTKTETQTKTQTKTKGLRVRENFKSPGPRPPKKKKQTIPLLANVGFGLSQYKLSDAYKDRDALVFGTELSIAAVAEREVLDRFKDRVPPKFKKAASKLREVSVTSIWVPKTIYIQPLHDHREAYGVTWGIVPTIMLGPSFLKLVVQGGLVLTYLYYRDDRFPDDEQSIHFIRPGLRGGLGLRMPLLTKYLLLEAGVKGDAYISQEFFDKQDVWNFSGVYGMIHFRIPFSVEAEI